LQEKKSPVFMVATANDVSQLPPEMLRKGRFDELIFVDLPNQNEREAIWGIQIRKYGRNPSDFDLVQLGMATDGLTGSEIQSVFADSLYLAYDSDREPAELDVARILTEFVPLSKLMAEQITGLRSWAKGRARLATLAQEVERVSGELPPDMAGKEFAFGRDPFFSCHGPSFIPPPILIALCWPIGAGGGE
jgi:SpoVK/Ycf46/Vps4 family AAA+-type ATPase